MQDLGMINLVRNIYPNLEIHASTQFHNHNIEGLKFLKSIGITRAVLARELTIEELKRSGLVENKEILNMDNKEELTGCIKIYYDNNKHYLLILSHQGTY